MNEIVEDDRYLIDIEKMILKLRETHGSAPKRKREEDENDDKSEKHRKVEMTLNYIHVCHIVAHIVAGIIIVSGMAGFLSVIDGTISIEVLLRNLQNILSTSTIVLSNSKNIILDIVTSAFNGLGPQFALVGFTTHIMSTGKSMESTIINNTTSGIQGMNNIVHNLGNIKHRFQSTFTDKFREFDQFYDRLQESIANSLIHCQTGELNARLMHEYLKPVYEWLIYGEDEDENVNASSSYCSRSVWRELSQTIRNNLNEQQSESAPAAEPQQDNDESSSSSSSKGAGVKRRHKKSKIKTKSFHKRKTIKYKKQKKRSSVKKKQ